MGGRNSGEVWQLLITDTDWPLFQGLSKCDFGAIGSSVYVLCDATFLITDDHNFFNTFTVSEQAETTSSAQKH